MHVLLPIICYNHTCHAGFMFSLMKLVLKLKDMSIDATLFPIGFDSLVNRARNASIAYFMSGQYTHLLFLDTDIEFNTEDIIKLLHSNEKLIGIAYAQKWLDIDKMNEVFKKDDVPANPLSLCTNHSVSMLSTEPLSEKMEVHYLTTGCMLIDKAVIDILIRAYPERRYTNTIDGYGDANKNLFYNFFSVEINPETNQYESEDHTFCRLWKEQCGKIYLIPDVTLTHYGWFGYQANVKSIMEYNAKK